MIRLLSGRWTCSFVWLGLVLAIAYALRTTTEVDTIAAMLIAVSLVMLGLLVMLLKHGQESREKLEAVLFADRRERESSDRDLALRATMLETRAAEMALLVARENGARSDRVDQSFAVLEQKLDENTRVSAAAADASCKAECVANDVNQKIQSTNERVTQLAEQILKELKHGQRK